MHLKKISGYISKRTILVGNHIPANNSDYFRVVVPNCEDVIHQLHVRHVHRFADSACVLSSVVMSGKLEMLINLLAFFEGNLALGAYDKSTLRESTISVRIRWLLLGIDNFFPCNSILATDKALPFIFISCGDAEDEASLVVVVPALEVD